MCPVDGAIAMLLRLDSGMDFIINVVSHQSIFFFNYKIIQCVNYLTGIIILQVYTILIKQIE